jgi:hypothetical protein
MSKNEANVLRISRLLTPEHRADLLAFIHLTYAAETSNGTFSRKLQEYSCRNNVQRSKK